MAKKLFIKTYGCQMNVYDSGRMADVLAPLGYEPVDTAAGADMVILNTCHIREKAAEKVYSALGRLRALKNGNPDMAIAVAGCVAQAEGEEIRRRAPYVDLVFGPQTYHRLPEMVAKIARQGRGLVDTDFPPEDKFDYLPESQTPQGISAFLTIQEGCDKFCSFCVVPYTRGTEASRPAAAILAEARRLVENGAREITLLGQNVNAYHGAAVAGSWNLARLIDALAEIPDLARIRYTTSHPLDMDDELIAAHGSVDKLMPYLHLPVQSGSDRILAEMNRRHDVALYLDLIEKLRRARPDLAFSSDFIIGFPGETDAEFDATLGLIERVVFPSAYAFKYSPRPGTPAALLPHQVSEDVKEARLSAVLALLRRQQTDFAKASVGQVQPVLFERSGRHQNQVVGRNPYLVPVNVTTSLSDLIGTTRLVLIEKVLTNSLSGTVVDHEVTSSKASSSTRIYA